MDAANTAGSGNGLTDKFFTAKTMAGIALAFAGVAFGVAIEPSLTLAGASGLTLGPALI